MINKKQKAFTLVELIVIMAVLIIISTVWFLSYISYLSSARDSNRITQITSIHDLLELQKTKSLLPLPDNYVEVISNSETIWYQGYVWENVLGIIEFKNGWKDPKDDTYFSYYLASNRKDFQLMAFLEDNENLVTFDSIVDSTYANNIDYLNRFPVLVWTEIWILTDTNNTPIQEITDIVSVGEINLSTTNSWTTYLSHIKNGEVVENSWERLQYSLMTNSSSIYTQPDECPTWFIPVPWNSEFNQKWFCVAKYEMTYLNWSWTPDSVEYFTDSNTYAYTWWLYIASKHDYPIADITQGEAIDACMGIWKGYHLITNNEWMTIARNIELQEENWSSWITWTWFIWNWNSSDSTMWCEDWTWPRTYITKTWSWSDSSDLSSTRVTCDEKRQLLLSNNEIIWDLAWNVWEHVNKANTIDWSLYNSWQITATGTSIWTGWDDDWIYNLEDMNKYASIFNLWINHWMWNIKSSDGVINNIFIRWGRISLIENTWIFSLHLGKDNTSLTARTGFRCAKY